MTPINYYTEGNVSRIRDMKKLRDWIIQVVLIEKKQPGMINFIFCNDDYLIDLNQKYLKHNTYTDIITFDYTDEDAGISGDIFISIDRVRDNAKAYKKKISNELHRVMCHGVLHLIGYKDKTTKDSLLMRKKEDYYLSLLPNFL